MLFALIDPLGSFKRHPMRSSVNCGSNNHRCVIEFVCESYVVGDTCGVKIVAWTIR